MTRQDEEKLQGRFLTPAEAVELAFQAGQAYQSYMLVRHKDFKQIQLNKYDTLMVIIPRIKP